MKKPLFVFLLLGMLLNVHATLLEYNYTGSKVTTGGGLRTTNSFAGLMVYDSTDASITFISWRPLSKTYSVSTSTNYHFIPIYAPHSVTNVLITHSSSGFDTNGAYHLDNWMVKGNTQKLKIATGWDALWPASFSGTNQREIFPSSHGYYVLETWAETMSFSTTRTVADNDQGATLTNVIGAMSAYLESRGYIRP